MKTYLAKTGGGQVQAVQLTESFSANTEALALMPQGFKVLSRVGSLQGKFQFRGDCGDIGDWFIKEPGKMNGHFLAHEHFEAQFYLQPSKTKNEINCKGCWEFGNNCGECPQCIRTKPGKHTNPDLNTTNPNGKNQNALAFEMAVKEIISQQMATGLTVTEAVGTLHLCAADIANQFFFGQKAHEFFKSQN